MKTQYANQRRDFRHPVTGKLPGVLLSASYEVLTHVLLDVSKFGLGITVESKISRGDIVTLNIEGVPETPIRLQVRWVNAVNSRSTGGTQLFRCGLTVLNRYVDLEGLLQRFESVQFERSISLRGLFSDKRARVGVFDSAVNFRHEVIWALKDLGFENFVLGTSVGDAKSALSASSVDWVICPVFAEKKETLFDLLRFVTSHVNYGRILVSAFVSDTEYELVPYLYENGLFSYHSKSHLRRSIAVGFSQMVDELQKNDWDPRFTAGSLLRNYLVRQKKAECLLKLEEGLLDANQENTKQMIRVAQANLLANNADRAEKLLRQAKIIDPTLEMNANDLLRSMKLDAAAPADERTFGFQNCVVVDPDAGICQSVSHMLMEMGATEVKAFSDGEEAWKWLSNHAEPDLILLEWKVPSVSGLALVQRIRAHGFSNATIMVLSSLLKGDDISIVNEMTVTSVVLKPFNRKEVMLTLRWAMGEDRKPSEQRSIEHKILSKLAENKISEARDLFAEFETLQGLPVSKRKYIEAEIFYCEENYNIAKDLVIESITQADGEALSALNLLGKCLLKLGDAASALKFLEKAQSFSPKNIIRQCLIAETHLELGDIEKAVTEVERARQLDAGHPNVKATDLKIAGANVDFEQMRNLLKRLGPVSPILGYMNNRAIAKVRVGHFEEGVELYRQVLKFISVADAATHGSVTYNLGLGYARGGMYQEALSTISLIKTKDINLQKKIASLSKKLKHTIDTGTTFEVTTAQQEEIEFESVVGTPQMNSKLLDRQFATFVKICLHGIYKHPIPPTEYVSSVMGKL